MKLKRQLFSLSENLDSLIAALTAFVLVQIFTKHSGIGISPDSVTYLSAARHMNGGIGFKSFDLLPVVDFPIGYPLFLTVITIFTRLDPLQFGPWLNGILFGMLLYTSGALMNGFHQTGRWYKRILLLCILFNPALQEVYSMMWSETIFLLLILFFILSISKYLKEPTLNWLLASASVGAFACLTRYAGIFLVPVGFIMIYFNSGNPLRKKILHCFMFGALSISFFLVNLIRNYWLTGFLTGQRQKGDLGFQKIIEYFGIVICDWLQIYRNPSIATGITLSVFAIFSLSIFFASRSKKPFSSFEYITAVTGLIYCLFMLLSSFLTRYEQFSNRLLSPVFVPLLWSLSWWIPGFIAGISYRLQWIFGIVFLMGAAWLMNKQLAADYEYYDGVKDAGMPGYREDEFTQSGIVQFVDNNKNIFENGYPTYSNAGDAVYFITGLPARQLPSVAFPKKLRQYYDEKNNYLVWFRDLENSEMPRLDSILLNKNMQLLKQLADGAVYLCH